MPFDYEELGPLDEMMVYVMEDGTNLHFAIKHLIDYMNDLGKEPERILLPPNMRDALRNSRDVDQKRMLNLTLKERNKPTLWCEIEGQHMLVDGTHRVARALFNGRKWVFGWIIPEVIWREFLITNLPDMSFDQVLALGTSGLQHRKRMAANGI